MRAVTYDAFRATPVVTEVADPEPAPHGAVIRVVATGLCRSDWHGWMGHDPDIGRSLPHVPGHEFAGVVEAVGPEVRGWRPGDRVTAPFVCACGTCEPCAAGDNQICDHQMQPGFTHPGSFAELVAIHHADVNLVRLPDGLGFDAAASLGCRFATAYRAVLQVGRVRPGERVAIHGCGGVGLSAIMIAADVGARVTGVDPRRAARAMAVSAGAEAVVADAAAIEGEAHVSIDAAGGEESVAGSLRSLRKRGRHVQVGLLPEPPRIDLGLVIARELELLGSHGMAAHAYPEMLAKVVDGRLNPASLVTRTIGLDDAPAALMEMRGPGITMIRPA